MSAQNKRCPGIYGKCSKIMPYWDNHKICRACRGYSCSPSTPCEVCSEWTEELWKKLSKCLHRASQTKSVKPKVSSSQAPAKGPASSDESQLLLKVLVRFVFLVVVVQHRLPLPQGRQKIPVAASLKAI